MKKTSTFRRDLAVLLNTHNAETESNTPDFVLADYLSDCLVAFDKAVNNKDRWHGIKKEANDGKL